MKSSRKSLLLAIAIVLPVGMVLRYCVPAGGKAVLVPLPGKNHTDALSHARAEADNLLAATANAFKTPIELYGIVVDQHSSPVAGATVSLYPVDSPYGGSSRTATTLTSDAGGKFSIKGLHGFSLGVSVKKDGYLHISPLGGPSSSTDIGYAHGAKDGKRHSNPATPVVLTLHKIGTMEPLVFLREKNWPLPLDGSPKKIAIDDKKGIGSHEIEFRHKTVPRNPTGQANASDNGDWSFEARIPGGGFAWNDSDYDSEAPESGYSESIRLEYKADMPVEEYKAYVMGSFFVKFPDGCYGRIRLSIGQTNHERGLPLGLTSWLNLKPGSRNLATAMISDSAATQERYKIQWK